MAPTADPILHLALPDDWATAFRHGEYTMSTRGRTLAEEGFIHCSRPHQVEAVANTFYADVDQLVLLTIDAEQTGAPIRDEAPAPGSPARFPHLYGPLPLGAVVDATLWSRSPDGWSLASL